ncbi:MAG TPA: ABC transporter transmembrane domain-containing protein, partial [Gemmatimonadales bacterium]|nr:ABC transporter transmembrane domain-containing protein [Gemmatimonadales bacterium]
MSDLGLSRRLLRQARPYGSHFLGLVALGLFGSAIALLNPVPLKIVVDSVLGTRPLPPALATLLPGGLLPSSTAILGAAITLLVAVVGLGQLLGLASSLLRTYVGERLVLDFRAQLVERVQRLSLAYHDARGTSDSLYRIQQDAQAIQALLVDGALPVVSASVTVCAMLAVTARLDGHLALVALAISPPLYAVSRAYRPRIRRESRQIRKLESAALAVVHETLGALRVVKAFGQEMRETERFVGRAREGMAARLHLALMQGRYGVLVGLITALGMAAVLWIGVGHVRSGVLSLGQLLMVMGYVGQLYQPLKTVSQKAGNFQTYLASVERAFALLDERPDVPERP